MILDHQDQEAESIRNGSFGRLSSISSSRRHSLSLTERTQFDDASESESASEAGDIGDRALRSNRYSGSGRSNNIVGYGTVFPIQEDTLLHTTSPSASENVPAPSVDTAIKPEEKKKDEQVPWLLEYITCRLSLAVFGILGVLARYCLEKLFGPDVIGATSDQSFMDIYLPSNMVGSFLMGWLGVVYKSNISKASEYLAIGLTTGFLGSLTTFSGWNQKILDLSVEGHWIFAVLCILLGLFLVAYSIILGIETAKGFRWLCRRSYTRSLFNSSTCFHSCNSNKHQCLLTFMVMLLLMLGLLWGLFGALVNKEFENGGSEAQLFLACMVGPVGVWIRWRLARFNGQGIGKDGVLKWVPFGTLAANVLAACVMAALATFKKAVRTKNCDTLASGIQFGLLGCLSTVSTFISEFHALRESLHPWRAYTYATTTFVISFLLGTLIYSVPVWVRDYN